MSYLKVEFDVKGFYTNVLKPKLNRAVWYLKQLFPLTYRSYHREGGKYYFSVFKMWFGRCYKIDKVRIYSKDTEKTPEKKRRKKNGTIKKRHSN